MKVFADWEIEREEIMDCGFGGSFLLSFDDEQGHELKNVTIQPEFNREGKMTDLGDCDSMDDLTLWKSPKEKKYYSATGNEFKGDDFNNILYFYESDESDDEDEKEYTIKEEVKEKIYKAVNEEVLSSLRWFLDDDNDKKSESPSILRARMFLQNTPFIVACNRFGKCATENFGWRLYGFKEYDKASKFYDEWEEKYYYGSEYLGLLTKKDEEYIASLLEYHGIEEDCIEDCIENEEEI